jgi:hypothetical protein
MGTCCSNDVVIINVYNTVSDTHVICDYTCSKKLVGKESCGVGVSPILKLGYFDSDDTPPSPRRVGTNPNTFNYVW